MQPSEGTKLYGLLHVAPYRAHANLRSAAADPIDVYLQCASLCAASVAAAGGSFALITNDAERLEKRRQALGLGGPEFVEQQFHWPVPPGIAFYSAHFKLEVIEAFAAGAFGDLVGLIDIDTVLVRPLRLGALPDGALAVYDITETERAAFGRELVCDDLAAVAGCRLEDARWYGGEFIVGAPAAFAAIAQEVRACWPNYVAAIGSLNHVGDEMVVSPAIDRARQKGLSTINVDRPGGVTRWWTARTESPIRPFREIEDRSLLHLPSDKEFLASYCRADFDGARFVADYRRYARRRLRARRIANTLDQLMGRGSKHVARID